MISLVTQDEVKTSNKRLFLPLKYAAGRAKNARTKAER